MMDGMAETRTMAMDVVTETKESSENHFSYFEF